MKLGICKIYRRRLALLVYLALAAAFLGVQMMQGLSFLDIGMYLLASQWFGSDPWACHYAGQWFMTFRITGGLLDAIGQHSFIALRVVALVLNICLQAAIGLYVSRFVPMRYVIAGLALATLACFGAYTDVGYNDYSVFLLSISIMLMHSGLHHRRGVWLAALSGAVLGVAFFFRPVNLAFLAMPLVAAAMARRCGSSVAAWRLLLASALGVAVGGAAMMAVVVADGSWPVLVQVACDFMAAGTNSYDSHSGQALIINAYTVWKGFVAGIAPVALLAALMAAACRRWHGLGLWLALVAMGGGVVLCVYFWEPPLNITAGMSLVAVLMVMGGRPAPWGRAESMAVLAMTLPMLMPIGSNGGPSFVGPWLGFLPLSVGVWMLRNATPTILRWAGQGYTTALRVTLAGVAVALLLANAKRPLMEDGLRSECRYGVDSPATRHILTTQANARMYALMLREVKPLVPRGSYMVCNFSLPLISVLECRPYAVFSDVFTSPQMNTHYILIAYRRAGGGGHLPYMLLDRETMTSGFCHVESQLRRLGTYRTLWTDGRYELLAPPARAQQPHPISDEP